MLSFHEPAIVLGCHKLGLGVIRALGEMKVPVVGVYYNPRDMGYVSRFVVAKYRVPDPEDDETGFVSSLVDLAREWKGGVLIPSDDPTLEAVSRNKNTLDACFKVSANAWCTTEKYIDKKYTYLLANQAGVPAPRTVVPKTLEEALDSVRCIGFPCLYKPSCGHRYFKIHKKKMVFVRNEEELIDAWKRSEEHGGEMMLQEFIPGDDTHGANYNSYFIDGESIAEFTAEKVRLSPPRIGFPRVIVSRHLPELSGPGRKMLRALGYQGFSCMEFKKDSRDGIYKLMEINGRQNLSSSLAVKCGINFPYLTYHHLATGRFPEYPHTFTDGVYWIDIGKDISESIRSYNKERFPLHEYVRPYLGPVVFSIPSFRDPMPLLKRLYDMLKYLAAWIVKAPRSFYSGKGETARS
jgi:predicted ATP-grasp superfamily ATP-dependent carboligase